LTHIEYARLQGFPDDHCKAATPYQQYKLYGNALPPHLAKWGLRFILNNKKNNVIRRPLPLLDQSEAHHG
jgi:DNA (cytosine-5)-methyltransferase 1